MCDCNLLQATVTDDIVHLPMRRYREAAEEILHGRGDRIAAGNLLFAIYHDEIEVSALPVTLEQIEAVAGRRICESVF